MSRTIPTDAESSSGSSSDSDRDETLADDVPMVDEEALAARRAEILTSVTARNAHFASLLSLIPAEHLHHQSDAEGDEPARQPNGAIKSKKAAKAAVTKAEKGVRQARTELKHERVAKRKAAVAAAEAEEAKGKGKADEESYARPIATTTTADAEEAAPSLADLRVKLDGRIKALQAARAPTREGLLADRRAKRERREERKRAERKEAAKAARRQVGSLPVAIPPSPTAETSLALAEALPAPPTGSLTFGHLDFTPADAIKTVDATAERKGKRKERPTTSSGDPSMALAAIEARRKFLSTHSADAKERAEERDRWSAMTARAGGEKVYDDEAKLKKAIRKREKGKERSKNQWAERNKSVEESQAARQQLRAANLAKRREEAKGGKKKSNKARPGFEGGRLPKPKGATRPNAPTSGASSSKRKGAPIGRPI